ncbi:MAG: NAD-binding protein [Anaerolineae bacterium]|nr:NAD-binding protein [Anaerolineae bacterium]
MSDTIHTNTQRWWRRICRDLRVLAHCFPWWVGMALVVGIAGMAALFQQTYNRGLSPPISYVKAVYAILNMIAFQISFADMPENDALDIFFVVVPLAGIPLLLVFGANILTTLRVFFVRGERGPEWQAALAATLKRPIVVCGLGRVGYRVAGQLLDLERPVVGIEAVYSPLVDALRNRDMPVILGDIRNEDVLHSAGVDRAHTVLVCTHNDLANIEAAFRVRERNAQARIILRLFEDEIATEIKNSFDVEAIISRSAIAAQAFAYAALGLEVLETFILETQTYALAKVPLKINSPLLGHTLQTLTDEEDMTVVCIHRDGQLITEPGATTCTQMDDTLFVFIEMERLAGLTQGSKGAGVQRSGEAGEQEKSPVMVCGVGHAGYRVVNVLLELKQPVIVLSLEVEILAERLKGQGVNVLYGDFRQHAVLEHAGVRQSAAIIACTENDMVNFETVLRARELNPQIRVVMRSFEEALGERLQQAFNIDTVYSTSAIAAPAFVTAALKMHIIQPVEVGTEQLRMARILVEALSSLYRERIDTLNDEEELTILLHKHNTTIYIPPDMTQPLLPGDEIIVLASEAKLGALSVRNRAIREQKKGIA